MKASIYRLFSIDMIKIFLCIERALGIFFPKILDDPRRLKRVPDKKLVVFAHFFHWTHFVRGQVSEHHINIVPT